jgi:hypothetical protein
VTRDQLHTWINTTSHSQSDSDRTPRAWTMYTGWLRVVVHRKIFGPGLWFVSCHEIGLTDRQLASVEHEDAQREALACVSAILAKMTASLHAPKAGT